MAVSNSTTLEEWLKAMAWEGSGPGGSLTPKEITGMRLALGHFLRTVPLHELNAPDGSSPWTPKGPKRTLLLSFMQAIRFTEEVRMVMLPPRTKLRQMRNLGVRQASMGNWFTYAWARTDLLAIPALQLQPQTYQVKQPILCLESTASDAFAGWGPMVKGKSDYRRGGGRQLFIYQRSVFQRPWLA